jgi:hypothetical protein
MPQLDYGPGLGEEHQPQQSVLDLPLNAAVQRYKRKTDQQRATNEPKSAPSAQHGVDLIAAKRRRSEAAGTDGRAELRLRTGLAEWLVRTERAERRVWNAWAQRRARTARRSGGNYNQLWT